VNDQTVLVSGKGMGNAGRREGEGKWGGWIGEYVFEREAIL
jgi:hypothetical protein